MRWMLMVLFVTIGLVAGGCSSLAVKNTEGLKAFLADQTEVERTAVRLRERFSDPSSAEYKQAAAAYDTVLLKSTQFIQSVKTESEVRNEVDVTIEVYEDDPSNVREQFRQFRNETAKLLGVNAVGMGLGSEAAEFVARMISEVMRLNNEARSQAVSRLKQTLKSSLMIEYKDLSAETLRRKYTAQ